MPRNYLQELSEYMDRPFQERNNPTMETSMERSQASMTDKPHLIDKPWYYGCITRYVCDNLLNQHGHDGDFLIRDSETNVSFFKTIIYFENEHICRQMTQFQITNS